LPAKLREEIALEVGEHNLCQYRVSAHTAIAKMTGLSESEISGG
jgi:AhpD family alkylhydroperoxidase